jgi:hypothetical protein
LCQIMLCPRDQREPQDTLIRESASFEWIPGLGALVEGYSLIVCKKHALSTAGLDMPTILELEVFLDQVSHELSCLYQRGIIVFEHGSMSEKCHAGGCIIHQHLHVLPADLPHLPQKLEAHFSRITSVSSLRRCFKSSVSRIRAPIGGS